MFDYIIVGAGSSGCALANRLSSDPKVRVLLIEAGPRDTNWLIHMPRGNALLMRDARHSWTFAATPAAGRNEPEYWLGGRMLGGTSSLNGQMYVRCQPEDFDEWAAWGCEGWSWADMAPHFNAMENHELGASERRGEGGPLHISPQGEKLELCEAFIAAGERLGLPFKTDLNEGDQEGVGYYMRNIRRGRRVSSAKAFLDPIRNRANLMIVTDCVVQRVLFEGRRAVGVSVRNASGLMDYRSREVILSAGALNSPRLLQLSGVGPADVLRRAGVEVVHDLPAVGENLRDHRMLPVLYRLNGASHNAEFSGWRLYRNLARYFLQGAGPLTHSSFEVGAFLRSQPEEVRADLQVMMGPFSFQPGQGSVTMHDYPGAFIGAYAMRSRSQGHVRIVSDDPEAAMDIDPNWLADPYDQQLAIAGLRFIRRIFATAPLADHVVSEDSPGAAVETDDEIITAYKRNGSSSYHFVGTCRMGSDPASVVDPQLRVRGVEGLRVIDCSVMPGLPSGNTNAPAMAMGLRAAEIIRATALADA
jgi:choline dehydrogenase